MSDEYDEMAADDEAAVTLPELPEPRANPVLIGHAGAEAVLLRAYLAGRLPHALLIGGPHGVGKATLAFRFARFLLAEEHATALFAAPPGDLAGDRAGDRAGDLAGDLAGDPAHPVFKRIAAGGHADLLTVERSFDPRRKRRRSEIVVEDVRTIGAFLRLTPAEGGWRIVVVDGADLMNRNAANALLKVLEEPPQRALLMLVSDNPGRLLPTIRSRCRRLLLKPLASGDVERLLRAARPDLTADDAAALTRLAEGSIGRALELAAAGGLALYRSLLSLLGRLPALDGAALHAFADRLARGEDDDAYRTASELLQGWLARMVAQGARGGGAGRGLLGEAEIMQRLAARRGLDQWVEVWEKITHLFAQVDDVNLDRKQVVLNAFFALEEAAR